MGHITNTDQEYQILQRRISQKVQDNPESATLMKILHLLFSPEDAKLVRRLPHSLTPVTKLAKKLKIPADVMNSKLTEMAQRGVVFDMEYKGQRYVTLPPVAIGFFEFVFMRARPDLPMKELAHLFEQYFTEKDGATAHSFCQGQTQLTRTFVMEETISRDDHSEILDWERATHIISSSSAISVGMCQCHHLAEHHGNACDKPQEVCLSFNYAAESMARNGIARLITKDEALNILEKCKEHNLIQIGDNVQRKVSFICNCCTCCCHLIKGIKNYNLHKGIVSSNWIMDVDLSNCKGCGKCAKVCPVDAISINKNTEGAPKKRWAVRDEAVCLGCGLCSKICTTNGAVMKPRAQRIIAPETIFDQRIAMAIERGKLAELLFDDPEKLSHQMLARLISVVEKSSPYKAAMASESIKSSFLNVLVKGAKRQTGDLTDLLT